MKLKTAGIVLIILLTRMLSPIFIEAETKPITIYIRADGPIDPSTAPHK